MNKKNKLKIIQFIILVGLLVLVYLGSNVWKDNQYVFYTIIGLVIIIGIIVAIIDNKIKKINSEESNMKDQELEKEFVEKLAEKENESDVYKAMYLIYTKQCIKINEIIRDDIFKITIDYFDDEDYFVVAIETKKFNKKNFFYSAICSDKMFLPSTSDGEVDIAEKTYDDIVELMYDDLKYYINNKLNI